MVSKLLVLPYSASACQGLLHGELIYITYPPRLRSGLWSDWSDYTGQPHEARLYNQWQGFMQPAPAARCVSCHALRWRLVGTFA